MIEPRYKKVYDEFIEHYKKLNISPWHVISEEEFENVVTQNYLN